MDLKMYKKRFELSIKRTTNGVYDIYKSYATKRGAKQAFNILSDKINGYLSGVIRDRNNNSVFYVMK